MCGAVTAVIRRIHVVSARDPGIHGEQIAKPNGDTALIVSSCGGPIGYQNLDGELSTWTGRPPAGSWLDPLSGSIRQIKTERCHIHDSLGFNEKPRLCVALDYLQVMSGIEKKGGLGKDGAIETPLQFRVMIGLLGKDVHLEVVLSEQMKRLECIAGLALWVFEGGGKSEERESKPSTWHHIPVNLDKPGNPTRGTLVREGVALLPRVFATGALCAQGDPDKLTTGKRAQAAFCEVQLQKPRPTAAGEDWGKDMVFDKDPWVFPVDVISEDGKTLSAVQRPMGERGEVPDWSVLADAFKSKGYVPAREAIKLAFL